MLLAGPWGQPLINGNVQPILMLLLALTPRYERAGPISLALATMIKLHPALGTVWFIGRRNWRGLAWYAGAMAVLLAIQAPWMGLFIDYYQTDSDASITLYKGWGLRLAGDVAWIIGAAITGFLAYRYAKSRYGWMLNIVFQLAALPRLLPTNLALLLSAPLPTRKTRAPSARDPDRSDIVGVDDFPVVAVVQPASQRRVGRIEDVVDPVSVERLLRIADDRDRVDVLEQDLVVVDVGPAIDEDRPIRKAEPEIAAPLVPVEDALARSVVLQPRDRVDRVGLGDRVGLCRRRDPQSRQPDPRDHHRDREPGGEDRGRSATSCGPAWRGSVIPIARTARPR